MTGLATAPAAESGTALVGVTPDLEHGLILVQLLGTDPGQELLLNVGQAVEMASRLLSAAMQVRQRQLAS
jgi:hypothetical protein